MRKLLPLIAAPLLMIVIAAAANAAPSIGSVEIAPSSSIWMGETPMVKVICSDDAGMEISNVTLHAVGTDGFTIPTMTLPNVAGVYQGPISPLYLSSPNMFIADIACTNNISQQVSANTSFKLSNFSIEISKISPSPSFIGDQIEVNVMATKDGQQITSGMNFAVKMNGADKQPLVTPPFDPLKGWVIYLPSTSSSGNYNMQITGFYDRANSTTSKTIAISDTTQFKITRIDKSELRKNDTVIIDVSALDHGNKIAVDGNNLRVTVGSKSASVYSITPVSNYYTISFYAPDLPEGNYQAIATLSYNGFTFSDIEPVTYNAIIEGDITDIGGKGVSADLKFARNGEEKMKISTGSDGKYSGSLPPGLYDMEVKFPSSTLVLEDAKIEGYDDSINYYDLGAKNVDGLNVAGLHVFEVDLDYDEASAEMAYDETKLDEGNIKVYACSSWNKGRHTCSVRWREVGAYIDTIANKVTVNTSSDLYTYAIGTLSNLSVTYKFDAKEYPVSSTAKLSGVVTDNLGNTIGGASVTASITGTTVSESATTDENGIFSIEFDSPDDEGDYSVKIAAEKSPFEPFTKLDRIKTVRNRGLVLSFPDTIKVSLGSQATHELKIVNSGQTDLFDMILSIEGAPGEYQVPSSVGRIAAGEERTVPIVFSMPTGGVTGTQTATIKVFNSEISKDKIFSYVVDSPTTVAVQQSGSSPLTGFFAGLQTVYSPQIISSLQYVAVFAASAFTLAFALKKTKKQGGDNNVRNTLFEIKDHMERRQKERLYMRHQHEKQVERRKAQW